MEDPRATEFSSTEIRTVELINEFRRENGLEPLQVSEQISLASAHYAKDMAKYDAFGEPEPHVTGPSDYYPQGADLKVRLNNEGYFAGAYGENIASGQASAEDVVQSWKDSPGHREMMLNPEMTTIGIGLVENPDTEYGEFWVTDFGDKADATARTVSELAAADGGSGEGDSGGAPGTGGIESQQAVFPLPEAAAGDFSDDWGAPRPGGVGHEGTDLMGERGTELRAVVPGTVERTAGSSDSYYTDKGGYNVFVRSAVDVGPIEKGDKLYYGHMEGPPAVEAGERVEAGDKIGEMGSTGYGPEVTRDRMPVHLHFGWYVDDERAESGTGAKNPYTLLRWLAENGGEVQGSAPAADAVAAACPAESGPDAGGPNGGGPNGSGGPVKVGGGPQEGKDLVKAAHRYLGTPYILGGLAPADCNPNSIDCSCLVYLAANDINLPGAGSLSDDPQAYLGVGEPVRGAPQAGDIVVYDQSGSLASVPGGHIAIFTGNGNEIIHAIPPVTTYSDDYRNYGPVNGIRRIV